MNQPREELIDTLQRISNEWQALSLSCSCGESAACSICEIAFLLRDFTETHSDE